MLNFKKENINQGTEEMHKQELSPFMPLTIDSDRMWDTSRPRCLSFHQNLKKRMSSQCGCDFTFTDSIIYAYIMYHKMNREKERENAIQSKVGELVEPQFVEGHIDLTVLHKSCFLFFHTTPKT